MPDLSEWGLSRLGTKLRREAHALVDRARRRLQPTDTTRPVFVLGCGRSGTNMTFDQLGRSWRVETWNENHPAAFERWRLRDLGEIDELIDRSRAAVALFKPILDTPLGAELLDHYGDGRVLFVTRAPDDVVNSAVVRFGAENWQERVVKWMDRSFAEFRRSGVPTATAEAVRGLWRPSLDAVSAVALYWYFYDRLWFDLGLEGHPRARLIVYEEATRHPSATFGGVERWLRIDLGLARQRFADVSATSIGREPPPILDRDVAAACAELHQRLLTAAAPRPAD